MTSIKQALNRYYGVLVDKLFLKRNEILLVLCVIALSLDPLFCYLLIVNDDKQCLRLDTRTGTIAVVLRSIIDFLYVIYIILQFRASIVTLSSQTNGAVWRSFLLHLLVDVLVILPLPQVLVFVVIPKLNDSRSTKSLNFIFIIQYVLRVLRICSLLKIVLRNSGILAKSPWANLFLLMLASHVLGAFWYLFSIERKAACWLEACNHIGVHCSLYCGNTLQARTFLNDSCSTKTPNSTLFDFGIYLDALASEAVHSADIVQRISYCFWWGLQNLSSLGQGLKTSTYVWEIYFSVFVSISGLLSFAFLIGNLQAYLLSEVARSEEMRLKRKEMESWKSWMAFWSFPENLKERILRTIEGKLKENTVINTHNLLDLLPLDLRKEATWHLGSGLLRRVSYVVLCSYYLYTFSFFLWHE